MSLLVMVLASPFVSSQPELTRGPYLQALLVDSVKVLWLTDTRAVGKVKVWPLDDIDGAGRVVEEETAGTRHEVKITGLSPWTLYHYEVLADDVVLTPDAQSPEYPEFQFRTAPPPGTGSFRALVFGDSQNPGEDHDNVARLLSRLADMEPGVHLTLHTGDIGGAEKIDDMVFLQYQKLVRQTPFCVARGNHDLIPVETWYELFSPPDLVSLDIPPCDAMPEETCPRALEDPPRGGTVPSPRTSVYYSFDWGPAHIAFIDSNSHGLDSDFGLCGDQFKWLCHDMTAAKDRGIPWRLLFLHHPTYSIGLYGPAEGNNNQYLDANERLAPLVDALDVDIVFCGHDHSYQRSHPIRDRVVVDAWQSPRFVRPRGTIYIVTAGGGNQIYGQIDNPDHKDHIKLYLQSFHALELEVSTTQLHIRARDTESVIIDAFSISKEGELHEPGFIRGDVDYNGTVNLTDAIRLLTILFLGGSDKCPQAFEVVANVNNRDGIDISDPVFLLNYLFLGGPEPEFPFGECTPLTDFDDSRCLEDIGCRL